MFLLQATVVVFLLPVGVQFATCDVAVVMSTPVPPSNLTIYHPQTSPQHQLSK
jgi:hypothetical protein